MSSVAGIRISPRPVPLSGARLRVAPVPVRMRVPVVVLSVFRSVGVTAGVGPGLTSVIHGDPFARELPLTPEGAQWEVGVCELCL